MGIKKMLPNSHGKFFSYYIYKDNCPIRGLTGKKLAVAANAIIRVHSN